MNCFIDFNYTFLMLFPSLKGELGNTGPELYNAKSATLLWGFLATVSYQMWGIWAKVIIVNYNDGEKRNPRYVCPELNYKLGAS